MRKQLESLAAGQAWHRHRRRSASGECHSGLVHPPTSTSPFLLLEDWRARGSEFQSYQGIMEEQATGDVLSFGEIEYECDNRTGPLLLVPDFDLRIPMGVRQDLAK